jgi:hypothetical protein
MIDASPAERWRTGSEQYQQVQSGDCRGDWDYAINCQQGATTFTIVSCALAASVAVSDAKQEARQKKSGCRNCVPSLTSSIAATLVPDPDRYRSGLVA